MAEYGRALETEPGYGLANHFLGRAYLAKGQFAKATEQLRRWLGAVDEALDWLERAAGERNLGWYFPEHPRFRALMRRTGVAAY